MVTSQLEISVKSVIGTPRARAALRDHVDDVQRGRARAQADHHAVLDEFDGPLGRRPFQLVRFHGAQGKAERAGGESGMPGNANGARP